jgi:hypothetical protein
VVSWDASVVDNEWGRSLFTPNWLKSKLGSSWRLVEFAEGRDEGNQDVYVLQRVQTPMSHLSWRFR